MVFDTLRQAAATLLTHPLRASLGALAIAVAVATIVVVVAALDGVQVYARATTARTFGADTFLVAQVASPGRVSRRELRAQLARNPPIRRADVAYLEHNADGRVLYAPNAQARAAVSAGTRELEDAAVTGTTAALADIREIDLARGRFFRDDEDRAGAFVAVIGADVADTVFPTMDPLGQSLRLSGRRFVVIGVQTRLGSAGAGSLDKYVWIPIRAYERIFGAPRTLQIFAKAAPGIDASEGEGRARISLRAKRALAPSVADNFDVLTPDAARGFVANLSARVGAAAGPISLMALIAAIVVVTNTVLVSVSERTREIGVRRALGARRGRIMAEVLAESTLMSLVGGLAGAMSAAGLLMALGSLLDFPLPVAASTIAWSVTAAAASGLAAGWYPAWRATRLDIINAIRMD
jgi:putative ABC transport system permease protein